MNQAMGRSHWINSQFCVQRVLSLGRSCSLALLCACGGLVAGGTELGPQTSDPQGVTGQGEAGNSSSVSSNGNTRIQGEGSRRGDGQTRPDPNTSESCDDNPLLATCRDLNDIAPAPPITDPFQQTKATVEQILSKYCGECHGGQLSLSEAKGGMNYIDDLDRLIAEQQLIGGDSTNSPIIIRMRNGSMPPPAHDGPRPSDADINVIATFLDTPALRPIEPRRNCAGQVYSIDGLYFQMQADLASRNVADRTFTRYLALTNRIYQGLCPEDLDIDRFALNKALNMLSRERRVQQAEPIDRDELVYRIDLRDFGWDLPVTVAGQEFDTAWNAIVQANAYATEFEGPLATPMVDQAGTPVPWMYANSLLDATMAGALYYALLGVNTEQLVDAYVLDTLGVDLAANRENSLYVRAGFTSSRAYELDVLVERHAIPDGGGGLWQAFLFPALGTEALMFDEPLVNFNTERQLSFSLSNGFLGFLVADTNGRFTEGSSTAGDGSVARLAGSCSGCHARGNLGGRDEVRSASEQDLGLDPELLGRVRAVYPEAVQFERIIADDGERFQRSLSEAGVPTNITDPVQTVLLAFDKRVGLEKAAAELGVTAESFTAQLNELNARFLTLAAPNQSLLREEFSEVYRQTLCVLHDSSQNRPAVSVCNN